MGLDNGINIKFKDLIENLSPKLIKKLKYIDYRVYEKDHCNILYWRKCQNIKKLFKNFCSANNIKYQEADNTPLTIDETIKFIECLLTHHTKKWWDETSEYGVWFWNSIWNWNDVKYYKYEYKDALKLLKYIKKNIKEDSYVIYFYDSY